MKKGFAKIDEDIRSLLLKLDRPLAMMSGEQAARIKQGWDICRELSAEGGWDPRSEPQAPNRRPSRKSSPEKLTVGG